MPDNPRDPGGPRPTGAAENRSRQRVSPPCSMAKDLSGWQRDAAFQPVQAGGHVPRRSARPGSASGPRTRKSTEGGEGRAGQRRTRAYLASDQEFRRYRAARRYRTVRWPTAASTCGRTPQVQIWGHTKEGAREVGADKARAAVNNSPGAPGKEIRCAGRPAVRPVEPFRILMVGEASPSPSTTSWSHFARLENFWEPQAARCPAGADPASDARRRRSAGATCTSAKSRPAEGQRHPAPPLHRVHGVFNGKDFHGLAGPVENYEGQGRGHRVPAPTRAAPFTRIRTRLRRPRRVPCCRGGQ